MPNYKNDDKIQINIWVERDWRDKLQHLARLKSVKEDKTISYLDLIKDVISEYISGSLEGKE